jgi:chromosome segregation ATPase
MLQSFSAIVGPNGSGKSNTIDALLFVFGYRASKMRQAKVSELIHNSAAFPDLDECSVEVHFREIIDLASLFHIKEKFSLLIIYCSPVLTHIRSCPTRTS